MGSVTAQAPVATGAAVGDRLGENKQMAMDSVERGRRGDCESSPNSGVSLPRVTRRSRVQGSLNPELSGLHSHCPNLWHAATKEIPLKGTCLGGTGGHTP